MGAICRLNPWVAVGLVLMAAGCMVAGPRPETGGPPARPSAALTLIAAGDIAYCLKEPAARSAAERTARLVEWLLSASPEAQVLTLGDNVYEDGTAAEFLSCYEPTWGRFKQRTWATPGNHDYGSPNAQPYFDYFGDRAGPDRRGFYRVRLRDWTLVSLNSNVPAEKGSPQYLWLEQQLREAGSGCLLAVWHHPYFTSAPRGNNRAFADVFDLLERYRADLVLAGHEHHFERFGPRRADGVVDFGNGLVSMVVGTGGAPLSGFLPERQTGSVAQIRQHGVLELELRAQSARWRFVSVDRLILDSGSLECRQ